MGVAEERVAGVVAPVVSSEEVKVLVEMGRVVEAAMALETLVGAALVVERWEV